ncbi:MAG TPA: anthranilate phosphoribosyltransferase, partial [Cyclobacteriaceae bacterium]|nr:anthranilate phosphoribosyltransferase [Cyclobacteriaceae bacterium]
GVKTFFNMLGPMVNPASPKYQLAGVFSLELARKYGYLYQQSGRQFVILHALDGYDEISLTGAFKYFYNEGEQLAEPSDLGLPRIRPDDIAGGNTVEDSAKIFLRILEGKGTPAQHAAVAANAGMALYCADQKNGVQHAVARATEALVSGKAHDTFKKFLNA